LSYLSVCSGIEAATVAWEPLGWRPVAFAEVEPFPSAVLAHHYPEVPNLGDMTRFQEWPDAAVDVLVGGTPCQSFSVAGLRKGLDDPRGNLALVYLGLAERFRPDWVVWENVPGVLSSNRGRDFGAFLGALGKLGYGWAYRVLDAQFIRTRRFSGAVPQRRRRVFVVGHLGDWRRAGAVLFDGESLRGNPPPRREAGKGVARVAGGGPDRGRIAGAVSAKWSKGSGGPAGDEAYNLIAFDAQACGKAGHAAGDVPGALHGGGKAGGRAAIAFSCKDSGQDADAGRDLATRWAVRRLTPRECERLQGFPDGYTDVPYGRRNWTPDGPRYKALGNSMAVNAMEWIGRRIEFVRGLV
jgi:DNA (cytosine-5)-methyltransferase 1